MHVAHFPCQSPIWVCGVLAPLPGQSPIWVGGVLAPNPGQSPIWVCGVLAPDRCKFPWGFACIWLASLQPPSQTYSPLAKPIAQQAPQPGGQQGRQAGTAPQPGRQQGPPRGETKQPTHNPSPDRCLSTHPRGRSNRKKREEQIGTRQDESQWIVAQRPLSAPTIPRFDWIVCPGFPRPMMWTTLNTDPFNG